MLFALKFLRWIYNTLAGAMTPAQIAYGLCLGVFVALMPMGLQEPQTWAIVALVLLTRASIWLFMLAAALLKPLMLLGLDALPWHVGRFVLEETESLREALGAVLNWPVLAIFPLDRYAVIVAFPLVYWFVIYFRTTIQPRAEQYRIIRWWRGFWLTRALSFVFSGEKGR